jgi:hypothetical protein
MTEAEFVKEVTDGLLPPPAYFWDERKWWKQNNDSFESVLNNGMRQEGKDFELIVKKRVLWY